MIWPAEDPFSSGQTGQRPSSSSHHDDTKACLRGRNFAKTTPHMYGNLTKLERLVMSKCQNCWNPETKRPHYNEQTQKDTRTVFATGIFLGSFWKKSLQCFCVSFRDTTRSFEVLPILKAPPCRASSSCQNSNHTVKKPSKPDLLFAVSLSWVDVFLMFLGFLTAFDQDVGWESGCLVIRTQDNTGT